MPTDFQPSVNNKIFIAIRSRLKDRPHPHIYKKKKKNQFSERLCLITSCTKISSTKDRAVQVRVLRLCNKQAEENTKNGPGLDSIGCPTPIGVPNESIYLRKEHQVALPYA